MANTPTSNFLIPKPDAGDLNWEDEYATFADTVDAIGMKTGRNLFINGNFDLWQNGTSFTAPGEWADRWVSDFFGTGGAATISREAFTVGQTDVPGEPAYYLRHDRTTASTDASIVVTQLIKGVRTLAGQQATVSLWAKAGASKTFIISPEQNFGAGGTPSAAVFAPTQDMNVTTAWQKFTFTFDIPSISGQTLGNNGDDYLSIRIVEFSSFSTFALDVAQVQIEKGSVATEFDQKSTKLENEHVVFVSAANAIAMKTGKNLVINGNFDLWQRGTSFTGVSTGAYTADRWLVWETGGTGGSVDISRQAFTVGQIDVPGDPEFHLRWSTTAGDSNFRIFHRVEGARTLANRKVTFSFWAKADAAVTISTDGRYNFGSGGSGQLGWPAFGSHNLTTSWQKFSGTISTPSITGKTIGPGDYCEVDFDLASGNSRVIDIASVQLEEGEVVTEFEQRPPCLELDMARRYARKVSVAGAGIASSTVNVQFAIPHEGMRAAPSASVPFGVLEITNSVTLNFIQSTAAINVNENDANGSRVNCSNFTGLTTGDPYIFVSTSSEIFLDAEL